MQSNRDPEDPDYVLERIDWSSTDSILSEEPSRFVYDYKGRLFGADLVNDEDNVVFGEIDVCFVDSGRALNEGEPLFDVMDCHSSELEELFCVIHGEGDGILEYAEEIYRRWPNLDPFGLLHIRRVVVAPKYRGFGIGLDAMQAAMERFGGAAALAALKAFPLQCEGVGAPGYAKRIADLGLGQFSPNLDISQTKLMVHYSELGFVPVGSTGFMLMPSG